MKKETARDYSFNLTIVEADGTITEHNITDTRRGYRQSWFATEKAARKGLERAIGYTTNRFSGGTVKSWVLYNRNHGIGIIETYEA